VVSIQEFSEGTEGRPGFTAKVWLPAAVCPAGVWLAADVWLAVFAWQPVSAISIHANSTDRSFCLAKTPAKAFRHRHPWRYSEAQKTEHNVAANKILFFIKPP